MKIIKTQSIYDYNSLINVKIGLFLKIKLTTKPLSAGKKYDLKAAFYITWALLFAVENLKKERKGNFSSKSIYKSAYIFLH